jgi:effector-binding domain-containing protein
VPVTIHLQRLGSIPLAVIRRIASASELARVVPECCGLVWDAVRAQQTQAGRNVAIYWDSSIRLEVGVELHGPFAEHGDVMHSATPAGVVASATHFGPYGALGVAHNAIREWCIANHHSLAGPNWEVYGHWQPEWSHDPSQIRTDVCYLLTSEHSHHKE